GAVHEEVFGHERPRFFARGIAQRDHYSFRRTPVDAIVAAEVRAVRERAGIMDISAFTKVRVSGPGSAAALDRLLANRLPKPGRVGLAHILGPGGRIELETTVVNLGGAEETFYLVCAAFFEQRLLDHLAAHGVGGVTNLSDRWAALALNGPRARDILAACTDARLDNGAFPWMAARQITVAGHPLWALRMSYAGELGWEFHVPREATLAVYEALWAAGAAHGLTDYGSFAMNAMRMEKAFKGAGELTNEVTLAEADVLRFARRDKDFVGADRTFAAPRYLCAYLDIEPDRPADAREGAIDGHGGEAVLLGGKVVGSTSSVVYGPTVGRVLAFAYLSPEAARPGTELEVLIHGAPRAARVLAEPAYDPGSVRPRTDAPDVVPAQ
ncbi:MAG: aminomethyltransferase family protein, partial [Pseudomonadota bacterium]